MNDKMTIKELLQLHNEVAAKLDLPPLKSWSKPKSNLMARIRGLQSELPAEAKPTAQRQPSTGKVSVKGFIEQLIGEGHDNDAILKACEAQFPDVDWTGNRRTYPQWYRGHLKRQAQKQA